MVKMTAYEVYHNEFKTTSKILLANLEHEKGRGQK